MHIYICWLIRNLCDTANKWGNFLDLEVDKPGIPNTSWWRHNLWKTAAVWSYQAMQHLQNEIEKIYIYIYYTYLVGTGLGIIISRSSVNWKSMSCLIVFTGDRPRPTNATELVDIEQQLEQFRGSTLKAIVRTDGWWGTARNRGVVFWETFF